MELTRRDFFKGAALTMGGALLASCGGQGATASIKESAGNAAESLPLKLSFQEGIAPGESLNEKFDFMEKLGVVGFEPGGKGLGKRVDELRQALMWMSCGRR